MVHCSAYHPNWDCFKALKSTLSRTSPDWASGYADVASYFSEPAGKLELSREAVTDISMYIYRVIESILSAINSLGLASFKRVELDSVGGSFMITVFYDDVFVS